MPTVTKKNFARRPAARSTGQAGSKSALPADRGLTKLGRSTNGFPDSPTAATLETFRNLYPQRDYWIRFATADFTSLCPVTGQADFAHLTIDYVPDVLCIETKSLKLYLSSFRNTRSFNEEIVNRLLGDFISVCQPRQMIVHGAFAPRGGISVTVEAAHPAPSARPVLPARPGERATATNGTGH